MEFLSKATTQKMHLLVLLALGHTLLIMMVVLRKQSMISRKEGRSSRKQHWIYELMLASSLLQPVVVANICAKVLAFAICFDLERKHLLFFQDVKHLIYPQKSHISWQRSIRHCPSVFVSLPIKNNFIDFGCQGNKRHCIKKFMKAAVTLNFSTFFSKWLFWQCNHHVFISPSNLL